MFCICNSKQWVPNAVLLLGRWVSSSTGVVGLQFRRHARHIWGERKYPGFAFKCYLQWQGLVCHAKHPLDKETKQCVLKLGKKGSIIILVSVKQSFKNCPFLLSLEAPVLVTQRSMMTVYEGSDAQLTCILSRNYPVTEITWFNNLKQHVNEIPKKYVLEQAAAWTNLTVRETDSKHRQWPLLVFSYQCCRWGRDPHYADGEE